MGIFQIPERCRSRVYFLQRYRVSNRNLREIFDTYIKQISFRIDFNDKPLALRQCMSIFRLRGHRWFRKFSEECPERFSLSSTSLGQQTIGGTLCDAVYFDCCEHFNGNYKSAHGCLYLV